MTVMVDSSPYAGVSINQALLAFSSEAIYRRVTTTSRQKSELQQRCDPIAALEHNVPQRQAKTGNSMLTTYYASGSRQRSGHTIHTLSGILQADAALMSESLSGMRDIRKSEDRAVNPPPKHGAACDLFIEVVP